MDNDKHSYFLHNEINYDCKKYNTGELYLKTFLPLSLTCIIFYKRN